MADTPRKRGRPPGRPKFVRLEHLIGWQPDDRPQATGRPRLIRLSNRDLKTAVEELTGKGCSVDQALRFLANYCLVDRETERLQAEQPSLDPSTAWDEAQERLSREPDKACEDASKVLVALRARYFNARSR